MPKQDKEVGLHLGVNLSRTHKIEKDLRAYGKTKDPELKDYINDKIDRLSEKDLTGDAKNIIQVCLLAAKVDTSFVTHLLKNPHTKPYLFLRTPHVTEYKVSSPLDEALKENKEEAFISAGASYTPEQTAQLLFAANNHRCYKLLSALIMEEKNLKQVKAFIKRDITYLKKSDRDTYAAKKRLYAARDQKLSDRFNRNRRSSYYLLKHAIDTDDFPLAARLLSLGVIPGLYGARFAEDGSGAEPHILLAFDKQNKAITDLLLKGDKHYTGERVRSYFLSHMHQIFLQIAKSIGRLTTEEFRFFMSLDGITPETVLINYRYSTVYHTLLKLHLLDFLRICVNEFGLNIEKLFKFIEDGRTQLAISETFNGSYFQDEAHKLLSFLFKQGMNPGQLYTKTLPLFHYAVEYFKSETILLFYKNGVSMNLLSADGDTPLSVALQNDYPRSMELDFVLRHGAREVGENKKIDTYFDSSQSLMKLIGITPSVGNNFPYRLDRENPEKKFSKEKSYEYYFGSYMPNMADALTQASSELKSKIKQFSKEFDKRLREALNPREKSKDEAKAIHHTIVGYLKQC